MEGQEGGEFVVPSRHWRVLVSPSKAPQPPKLSPNITVTRSVLLAGSRLPNGERWVLLWENTTALVESPLLATRIEWRLRQSKWTSELFPRKWNRLFFSLRTTDRGLCRERYAFPHIHIYKDTIERGIKINGREVLIRAYTRDAEFASELTTS